MLSKTDSHFTVGKLCTSDHEHTNHFFPILLDLSQVQVDSITNATRQFFFSTLDVSGILVELDINGNSLSCLVYIIIL